MNYMRVAMLLSNAFRPDPRVAKEASSLARVGHQVRIYCWDRQRELPDLETIEDFQVVRIHDVASTYGAGVKQSIYTPRFWRAAITLIKDFNPDIIHCHDLDTLPAGYWLKRTTATRLIFDAHEDYPALMSLYLPKPLVRVLHGLERFLLKQVDFTITASSVYAIKLRSLGIKAQVVGNYSSLKPYTEIQNEDIQRVREGLGIGLDDFVVAYIGGFTRNRLILPLIEAARQEPDVCVLIWGDGHQRREVVAAIAETSNVRYMGWLTSSLVPLYTSMVDVIYYCLLPDYPGTVYNAPNTLSNAMAAGRPVIANDVGDLGSIIRQVGCGILLPAVNPSTIREAIHTFSNPELRHRMGEAGRKAALERFNWQEAEKSLIEIYQRIT